MAEQVDQKKCAEELAEQSELKKSIDDLEKEVTCGVCQEVYGDAKLLPCGHYFCMECIMKMCRRESAGKPISCPECRLEFVISQETVADLKTAFNINRLIDVHRYQLRCYKMVAVKANLGDCSKSEATSKCPEHDDLLLLYCYSCKSFICRDCALTNHNEHKYEYNTTAVPKWKEELLQSKNCFEKAEKEFQNALRMVRGRIDDVKARGQEVADFMSSYFKELRCILDAHEASMQDKHKANVDLKVHNLKLQEKKLLTACEELSSVQAGIDTFFSKHFGDDILGMSKILESVAASNETFKKDKATRKYISFELIPAVCTYDDINIQTSSDQFSSQIKQLVSFTDIDIIPLGKVVFKGFEAAVHAGEKHNFQILSLRYRHFSVSLNSASVRKFQVRKTGCYTYLVEYNIPRHSDQGRYMVTVLGDGRNLPNGQFYMTVKHPF